MIPPPPPPLEFVRKFLANAGNTRMTYSRDYQGMMELLEPSEYIFVRFRDLVRWFDPRICPDDSNLDLSSAPNISPTERGGRCSDTQREIHAHAHRQAHTEREMHTHTDTHRERYMHTHTDRHTEREIHAHAHRQTHTERDTCTRI